MKRFALTLLFSLSLFSFLSFTLSAYSKSKKAGNLEPRDLHYFKRAYPNVEFYSLFDRDVGDWSIDIYVYSSENDRNSPLRKGNLYWADCRFLPKDKLDLKERYRKLLYRYPHETPDPEHFTESEIKHIENYTSAESRSSGAIEPPFLYDLIYDTSDRARTESHIKKMNMWGKVVNLHESIEEPLKRVSGAVLETLYREPNETLDTFFSTLEKTDGFNWRTVRDTQSRSFHGMGLAIDILPHAYFQKVIYWLWQKQKVGEKWFMTPLSKRWMPPPEVIEAFEREGFVWGGKWMVWDNMHFEYRPELILFNK